MLKKVSFRARLLLITMLPLLATIILMTITSVSSQTKVHKNSILEMLRNTCNAILYDNSGVAGKGVDDLSFDEATGKVILNGEDVSESMTEVFENIKYTSGMDMTLIIGKTRRATSLKNDKGDYIIGTDISDEAYNTIMAGKEYANFNTKVNGQRYVVTYEPIILGESNKVVGAFFAGIPYSTIQKETNQTMLKTWLTAIILLIITSIVVVFISRSMVSVLLEVNSANSKFANGELNFEITEKSLSRGDNIGDIARGTASLRDKLQSIVFQIIGKASNVNDSSANLQQSAEETKNISNSVSEAIASISLGATNQAETIQNSVIALQNVVSSSQTLMNEINDADAKAEEMNKQSSEMQKSFTGLENSVSESDLSLDEVAASMVALKEYVDKVKAATSTIGEISTQTNLLSLNASIEASRAGDAGRGFAVVAEEIRKLSDESESSTKLIASVMSQLTDKANAAANTITELKKVMASQKAISIETAAKSKEVISLILQVRETFKAAKEECDTMSQQFLSLNDDMSSLSAISEENAASAEVTNSSMLQLNETVSNISKLADDLNNISSDLNNELKFFTI